MIHLDAEHFDALRTGIQLLHCLLDEEFDVGFLGTVTKIFLAPS